MSGNMNVATRLAPGFGRPASANGKRTCIVIVEIEPPPSFGARIRNDFIAGMGLNERAAT